MVVHTLVVVLPVMVDQAVAVAAVSSLVDLEELVDLDTILVEMVLKDLDALVQMVVLTLEVVEVVLPTQVELVELVDQVLLLSVINSNKYLKK